MFWPALSLLLAAGWLVTFLHFRRQTARRSAAAQAEAASLRAERAESDSRTREHQAALLNNMVEGVLVLDPKGRIQLANNSCVRLFGLTEPVAGRLLIEAVRSHELAALVERLTREPVIRGFEWRPAGPEERAFEVNAAALRDPDDTHRGCLLVFHDLTRLKRLEGVRKEFVANVSHELRTPLSVVQGFVESLRGGAKDDPALNARFLEIIERNVRRLSLLIQDLLVLSELESGRARLTLRPVELTTAVGEVVEELAARAAARGIKVVSEGVGLRVQADPHRLHQVLSNLIDNAIKYGRPDGHVRVSARPVADGFVEVAVADDGPGLPAEALERVFERFYRVDKGRSRDAGGTGLGLAIVKHLVQLQGGRVWVESELSHGAAFRFTLAASTDAG